MLLRSHLRSLPICLILWLMSGPVTGQRYDTPVFDLDRASDRPYVDSLLRATRHRIRQLNALPYTKRVDTARLELLLFTGTIHRSSTFYRDSAVRVARQVVALAQRVHNVKYQIKGLMLAEIYYRSTVYQYPQAVRINYQLLQLIEPDSALAATYLRRVYRNLGKVCAKIGQHTEAITYLTKAEALLRQSTHPDSAHLADLHQSMAETYVSWKKLAEAETHYLIALHALGQHPATQSSRAFLLGDLGRLYYEQRDYSRAITYLTRAERSWAQIRNTLPQANTLADLGQTYLAQGKYQTAIRYAKAALALNQQSFALQLTAYQTLAEAHRALGRWKQAFTYQQQYAAKREQEQQATNQTQTLAIKATFDSERLEAAHQTELKQLRINQLHERLVAEVRTRRQLYISLTVITALGLVLLYSLVSVKRKNRALRRKNEEIELALVKGQTQERKRVAAELHDRVSSLLGATKMTIQTIDAALLTPRNKQIYENSLHLLDDAAQQVRQLAHNFIPDALQAQGLVSSLHELTNKLNKANRVIFFFDSPLSTALPLNEAIEFNLYVIGLELCTNVLKHGQATQATLALHQTDAMLRLSLSDNGVGVSESAEAGAGLKNIRNRVAKIGGTFELWPNSGGGTTATVAVPV